jgi:rhodanese-related sulfurtransferase
MIKNISGKEFKELFEKKQGKLEIIDVREKDEFELIHIKGSKLLPVSVILENPDSVDWSKEVVFICRSGSRSGYVASMLGDQKQIMNLAHGIWELNMDQCDCLEKSNDCCEDYL